MLRLLAAALAVAVLAGCPSPQQGPQGPEGTPGPAGAMGPAGPQGPEGPQGPPGQVLIVDGGVLTGPQGPRGASVVVTMLAPGTTCPAGGASVALEDGGSPQVACNGRPGAQGPAGAAGPTGASGAAGASVVMTAVDGGACPYGGARLEVDGGVTFVCNGAPGVQGPAGAQGATGPQGATGAQGAAGPQGAPGDAGPPGPAGAQGPAGTSVVVTALSAGDANCPYGGSRVAAGATTTYACNGAPGPMGPPGAAFWGDGGAVLPPPRARAPRATRWPASPPPRTRGTWAAF